MPKLFRPEMPSADDGRRWVIGVEVSSRCTRASAVLLGALGTGYEMLGEVAAAETTVIPRETTDLFLALSASGTAAHHPSPAALAACRQQLAEIQATLVKQLLSKHPLPGNRALAVGVHDPGIWDWHSLAAAGTAARTSGNALADMPSAAKPLRFKDHSAPSGIGYISLSDPARLAELTGLNVIDAFPARDLVLGGQGGPVTALARWILLRSQLRHDVFLDLGRTVRLTYLPAGSADRAYAKVVAFDVGPGMTLLDLLTQRLTQGEQPFDVGGRLAVQGRRLPELIAHWLRDPYFSTPPPRWHPQGVRPERFLSEALPWAVREHWSIQDLLCSATSFLAEMIVDALRRHLPDDRPVDEILVAGGGVHNGFLLAELARLAPAPLVRMDDLPIAESSLEPAAVAVLALLAIDQVPASQTAVSNTATPRLLGRFTPGSPQHWQRLLTACATASQRARPLRAAV
ncbi:MAG: anhydro-N-acetylmuramic acid kinase [Pirellulales bacterium]|nr:anhydro-N-acetylmuramic acid kinase [Pirellulales bacterium]